MSFEISTFSTEKVSIADLTRFLVQHGFENVGSWGRYLQRYTLAHGDRSFDVLVPTNNDISDFNERIRDAVNEIAVAIEIDPISVVRNLSFVEHRIFKIRARPGMDIASLPYEEGVGLIENGWKLIKSSAVSAMSPKPKKLIRGRTSDSVESYMDRVRLGQTEVGSFVFNFLLPSSNDLIEGANNNLEGFDLVSDRLLNGITFTSYNLADKRVPSGKLLDDLELSANFFEALYNIIDYSDEVELQVASIRDQRKVRSEMFRFDRSYLSVIERTAQKLAPPEARVKETISGTITRLSEPEKKRRGSIDLLAKIDNRRRTVRIKFEARDRETIIQAFREKDSRLLTVTGYLKTHRSGHLVLEEPRKFSASRRGSLL